MSHWSVDTCGPTFSSSAAEIEILEEAEGVTVSWPDHRQVLLDGVWRCRVDNDQVDVSVSCKGGRLVQAHKLILGIFCPGFNERLRTTPGSVLDSELDGDDLDRLVEFIYRGKVTVPRDRLGGLKDAARNLCFQAMNDALKTVQCSGQGVASPRPASKKTAARGARKRKGKPVKILAIPPKKSGDDDGKNLQSGEKANDRAKAGRRRSSKEGEASCPEERGGETRQKRWRMKQPTLQCPHCSYSTRDKSTYGSHMAKHDPNAQRFTCETCSKTFRNQGSFRRHVRSHRHPDKLYKCTECEFRTPQKSTWIQHLAAIHQVDQEGRWMAPDVRCTQCHFACFTEYQLKSHVARKHATDKPHKCPECSYASIAKGDIDKHVRIMHRNERPYMCDTCGFRSKTRSAFNMHVRSHSGLKPYKCDVCGQAYTRSDKLKAHLQKHADYVCHACGQVCHTGNDLLAHLECRHPEAEGGQGPPQASTLPNAAPEATHSDRCESPASTMRLAWSPPSSPTSSNQSSTLKDDFKKRGATLETATSTPRREPESKPAPTVGRNLVDRVSASLDLQCFVDEIQ